jgi:hypothetical protein
MTGQMDFSVDLKEWRRVLTPCPMLPEPTVSYVFFVKNKLSEVRARIIEVLSRYGMPYVAFPDENNIIMCRMRFILEHDANLNTVTFILDIGRIETYLSHNPTQELESATKKAIAIINFAIALLSEIGLVNDENKDKIRDTMIRDWSSWIEVPNALLPIFLGKLMSSG